MTPKLDQNAKAVRALAFCCERASRPKWITSPRLWPGRRGRCRTATGRDKVFLHNGRFRPPTDTMRRTGALLDALTSGE